MMNIILAVILWPQFGPGLKTMSDWMMAVTYLFLCLFLTPLIGIPVYKYVLKL